MNHDRTLTTSADSWLRANLPDAPVFLFCPDRLAETAAAFLAGFPGTVSYAVKANPDPALLEGLVAAGITVFDVASPAEMALVRGICPEAVLHYHNPVRSRDEVAEGLRFGCVSWSVDRAGELAKLAALPRGTEVAVRLKLPVAGAVYDFGAKFGAAPEEAGLLLREVAAMGLVPSVTFHPGTQCPDPAAWESYIAAAAWVAASAGVRLHRLNVGGGFPARRGGEVPDLRAIFAAIERARDVHFGADGPDLVCEPGRALCAEALMLALRVKAVAPEAVFLNDGIYGGLAEWRDMGPLDRLRIFAPDGTARSGAGLPRVVFGPTCDSLDRLPEPVALPEDLAEGDFLLIEGMGAYSRALVTGFNGYGARSMVRMPAG